MQTKIKKRYILLNIAYETFGNCDFKSRQLVKELQYRNIYIHRKELARQFQYLCLYTFLKRRKIPMVGKEWFYTLGTNSNQYIRKYGSFTNPEGWIAKWVNIKIPDRL